jgi:hypothetical protein
MRSVKLTTLRNLLFIIALQGLFCGAVHAQDNSPYSRYGLGDQTPPTNVVTRGMGGFAAAYADPLSVNFTNPASYASFLSYLEQNSRKSASGRVIFDVGLNFDNHTLREGNTAAKFTSSNALFSYMQLGIPLRRNWGLHFGLQQLSRISYKVNRVDRLVDPITGQSIDSALTQFSGDGGSFLATTGMGFAIKNLSVGFNFGYLFGKKQYTTKIAFINDTVAYNSSSRTSETSFGNMYTDAGIQYKFDLGKKYMLHLGAYGNLRQNIRASQDVTDETITGTESSGDVRLDSVSEQKGVRGTIVYPSGYAFGLVFEKKPDLQNNKYGNWLVGADFARTNWSEYRFYGAADSVQNNWQLKVGAQIRPEPQKNYFSNVTYRAGFTVGQDYIHVGNKLPTWGVTFGMGLPLANYNQLARTQASVINIALEYLKRGNNDNVLKENRFQFSLGLSLSDLWFIKKKYD